MSQLLLYYQRPEPATWVFLSSFLLLGIYFVFHRFFSLRNLDILLLILLAPGLMLVYESRMMALSERSSVESQNLVEAALVDNSLQVFAQERQRSGVGLGGVELSESEPQSSSPRFIFAARPASSVQLVDQSPRMVAVREDAEPTQVAENSEATRAEPTSVELVPPASVGAADPDPIAVDEYPPTEGEKQGWSAESLEFLGFAALLLACLLLLIRMLIDPALVRRPLWIPNLSIGGLSFIGVSLFLFLMGNVVTSAPRNDGPPLGPGYALLNMFPSLPTTPESQPDGWEGESEAPLLPNLARVLAIVSNFAIVFGIVGVGYWHFDNVKTGIGCAVMYLLLPYSAQMTGNLEHVMPAAFMVLALLAYRLPLVAGLLIGVAAGLVYYPLFLLPLWISFYWKRGLSGLLTGVVLSLAVMAGLLLLQGWEAFGDHLRWMFGLWSPRMVGLEGIWGPQGLPPEFRLPVLVAFILLSLSFVFWPSRKNLGSLMCGTGAVMLAAQFWHGNGGGLFMAWFLPFALLTIFRPNLDDRVATEVVRERRLH